MQATAGPFPRADAASAQPQGRPGKHCVASTHERSIGRWKWEVLGRRGHSETKIALAVPAPELMQPQPSLRVVHGSIVWRQHMGGAHRGAKMGGFGAERPFLHWQCQLGTVPYTVPYFTVITVKCGVIITVVRRNLTSTVRTVQTVIVPYCTTQQA